MNLSLRPDWQERADEAGKDATIAALTERVRVLEETLAEIRAVSSDRAKRLSERVRALEKVARFTVEYFERYERTMAETQAKGELLDLARAALSERP